MAEPVEHGQKRKSCFEIMNLYIDIDRKESVIGPDNPLTALPLPFIQGETLPLRIYLLQGSTLLPVAGTTLEVAIGQKKGNGGTSYYTQQFSWTPSSDISQPYWEADLSLATSGINTLLGSSESAKAFFEVKKITAGIARPVLLKPITVQAVVIHDSVLTVPVDQTPISAEAVNAGFVPKIGFNGELQFINPDTGKGFAIYADSDGAFQVHPIS